MAAEVRDGHTRQHWAPCAGHQVQPRKGPGKPRVQSTAAVDDGPACQRGAAGSSTYHLSRSRGAQQLWLAGRGGRSGWDVGVCPRSAGVLWPAAVLAMGVTRFVCGCRAVRLLLDQRRCMLPAANPTRFPSYPLSSPILSPCRRRLSTAPTTRGRCMSGPAACRTGCPHHMPTSRRADAESPRREGGGGAPCLGCAECGASRAGWLV
jgi:hypothetical protein